MNEILTFVTNNGIAVVLMFYFLKNNHRAMTDLLKQNAELINEIRDIKLEQKEIYSIVKNCKKNTG
jgi:hypothetical protein